MGMCSSGPREETLKLAFRFDIACQGWVGKKAGAAAVHQDTPETKSMAMSSLACGDFRPIKGQWLSL